MNVYRPLRAALFAYELLRLGVLAATVALFSPAGAADLSAFVPYPVFVAPNALFPLMTLFLWLRLDESRAYLPLYLAGKVITIVVFYAWSLVSIEIGLQGITDMDVWARGNVFMKAGRCACLADGVALVLGLKLRTKLAAAAAAAGAAAPLPPGPGSALPVAPATPSPAASSPAASPAVSPASLSPAASPRPPAVVAFAAPCPSSVSPSPPSASPAPPPSTTLTPTPPSSAGA